MVRNRACSVAPARITPPRVLQPVVCASHCVSANHPLLPEELAQFRKVIRKPSPPTPSSEVPSSSTTQPSSPQPSPSRSSRSPQSPEPQELQVPQAPQEPEVFHEIVFANDRNPLPRNAGVVFNNHLQPRDENIPPPQARERNGTVKSKVKFSISCVTVSTGTSDSGQEDDIPDPFAPPAPVTPAPVAPQYQSLLTASLREHAAYMAAESSQCSSTDATGTTSRNPSQSTRTATDTSFAPDVKGIDPSKLTGRLPFRREEGKRYYDEPLPGPKACRPNPTQPSDLPKPEPKPQPKLPRLRQLPLKQPELKQSLLKQPQPKPKQSQPQPKPNRPPFSLEPSCPELSPASVAMPAPARVGRAPIRPAVHEPALDRPPEARQHQPPKAQPPKRAGIPTRLPRLPKGEGIVMAEGVVRTTFC
jgi:hypothetical protein